MMNTVKFLIAMIVMFLLNSCEFFDIDYDTYTIRNDSDYTVTIKAYSHNEKFDTIYQVDLFSIQPKDVYYIEKRTGEDSQEVGYFEAEADSVVIELASNRKLVYTCRTPYEVENDINNCLNARNIIVFDNGDFTWDNKRKGYDYEYILTNSDYENAMIY